MPGTVKSGLLSDADKSYKCDSQEKVCWILNLPLDKGHFITECQPSDFTHFGAQSFALLPCCLRLADTVTPANSRLATDGATSPFRVGFPPTKCTALGWAHNNSG